MEGLFPSEYDQTNGPPSHSHDQTPPVSQDAGVLDQPPPPPPPPPVELVADDAPDPGRADAQLRGKAATAGLSAEEKKERQKQQNRRAAERSRNKKREELTALEMTVNNIQDENNRLRARLAQLLASKGVDPTQPSAAELDSSAPGSQGGSGIDYATLSRLQAELASAKSTLLERELELARLKGVGGSGSGEPAGDTQDLHQELLSQTTALDTAQAEVKSLHTVIGHLRSDRDNLARQRDALAHEIEARRVMREAAGDPGHAAASSRASGVERALLEMRGMVDGVIKTWEQGSILGAGGSDGGARSAFDEAEKE